MKTKTKMRSKEEVYRAQIIEVHNLKIIREALDAAAKKEADVDPQSRPPFVCPRCSQTNCGWEVTCGRCNLPAKWTNYTNRLNEAFGLVNDMLAEVDAFDAEERARDSKADDEIRNRKVDA